MTTWHIGNSERCGTKKPHAVLNDDTGAVEGCHATLREARRHISKLMSGQSKSEKAAARRKVWPLPEAIPDRVAASEAAVAALYGEALRRWTPTLMSNVLPTLTAAGLPPDPGGVDAARPKWGSLAERIIVGGMRLLWADTAVSAMRGLGVRVPSMDADPEFEVDEYAVNAVASALGREPAAVMESASRMSAMPSLASAMNDHLDSIRSYADAIPDRVEAKVESALADAPDTATIEQMRVTAELVIAPGSVTMEDIAEWTARQAAGVENDAIVTAGRESPDAEFLEKVWIATNDEKTRPSHVEAHGQRVPLDALFAVGTDDLEYPGDPNGSAEEIINCRCRCTILAGDEELPGYETRAGEQPMADQALNDAPAVEASPEQALADAQFTWDVDEAAQAFLPDTYVNFSDMDPGNLTIEQATAAAQSAKNAVAACADVVHTYDNVYENLTSVTFDPNLRDHVFAATEHWGRDEYAVAFNPKWMLDPATMKAEFDKSVEDGYHYPGAEDPVTNVAVHEMGHIIAAPVMRDVEHLDLQIENALGDYYWAHHDDAAAAVESYDDWLDAHLSGYSHVNTDEKIAEAFVDAHINGDMAHDTSKVITKVIMDARDGKMYETPESWPFSPPAEGEGPPPINYMKRQEEKKLAAMQEILDRGKAS